MTSLEEILQKDGKLIYRTKGVSMEPMLRQNRDLVEIRVPALRLKKYDVALYKRGSSYVLHRVMKVLPDGYLIRGDNTYHPEKVPEEAVLGVLARFVRKGKTWEVTNPCYQLYVRMWQLLYPLRAGIHFLYRLCVRMAKKAGIRRNPFKRKAAGR